MLLMSVSDVFTMVPDVTNMALPYYKFGLAMAKSIPDTLCCMGNVMVLHITSPRLTANNGMLRFTVSTQRGKQRSNIDKP